MAFYGTVTRYPKPNEQVWMTQAFDSPEDPEGGFLYEFFDENGWKQPIKTRKDLEFFLARPSDYGVEQISDRPSRPARPSLEVEKPVDGSALLAEKRLEAPAYVPPAPKPVEAPVSEQPRKRMGRPPRSVETQS